MNLIFRALLCFAFMQLAWGDTVHLRDRGSEINGTVTFSNGIFHVKALFKKGARDISVGRDGVSEVRFNEVKDNPEDDAPDWMLHLSTQSTPPKAEDAIRFWDSKDNDVNGSLETITTDAISVQGKQSKQSFVKNKVRAVVLQ